MKNIKNFRENLTRKLDFTSKRTGGGEGEEEESCQTRESCGFSFTRAVAI